MPNDDLDRSSAGKTAPGPAPALGAGGELPPGYVVGEYRIERVIGRGGMGVVYAGVQPIIEKRIAIKVLHAELSSDPALVKRFVDEARAVNRIRHPNIIDIFSFGQLADGRQYFVMEYLEGRTLAERLTAGDLATADLPVLLGQICDALDAAHGEHIVHRDLKPENVWIVEPRHGRPFVKLLDFGIAKLLAAADHTTTRAGMLMGTPLYMSPEQCHGKAVDHRTDIYAMGVILYQIYTGKLPFDGESFAEVLTKQLTLVPAPPGSHANLPPSLDALIMRCLNKDAPARPQSARELGDALAAILVAPVAARARPAVAGTTTLGASAHAGEPLAEAPGSARRWPFVVGLLGVAAVAIVAVVHQQGHGQGRVRVMAGPSPVAPLTAPATVAAPAAMAAPAAGRDGGVAAVALPASAPAEPSPPQASAAAEAKQHAAAARPKRQPGEPARRPGSRAAASGLATDNPFR